jgi:hypothetical protein
MIHDPQDSSPAAADDEIASLLRRIPLRHPSADLDARILGQCSRGALFNLRARWSARFARAGIAIAATLAIVLGSAALLHHRRSAPPKPDQVAYVPKPAAAPPATRPIRLIRTLGTVANEGVVATPGGEPMLRFRSRTIQEVVVFDPRRGTHISYRQPVEQVTWVRLRAF